jgi:DNA processing protein
MAGAGSVGSGTSAGYAASTEHVAPRGSATSTDDQERRARMVLSAVCEPGDADACRLIREYSASMLLARLGAGGLTARKARDWAERLPVVDLDATLRAAEHVAARYLMPGDAEWPRRLDELQILESETGDRRASAPFGLWARGAGDVAALLARAVSVVGARASTAYGERAAGDLAHGLAEGGYTVVSGGAYGIDAAAHRGALAARKPTVAILAGGVDRLYPPVNSDLLRRVTADGVVLGEAAPGCAPSKSRFLVRNRLIAAVASGTVVVEAALRSGSLNTARWARDLGRHVMGLPGPVTSTLSAGVHELLRQPETVLVTRAAEVIELVSPLGTGQATVQSGPVRAFDELDARSKQLLDAVPREAGASSRSIAVAAGLHHDDVIRRLPELAGRGLVVSQQGGWRLA